MMSSYAKFPSVILINIVSEFPSKLKTYPFQLLQNHGRSCLLRLNLGLSIARCYLKGVPVNKQVIELGKYPL